MAIPTKGIKIDEHCRKSIQRNTEAIFKKAEDREKAGWDCFETGWQTVRPFGIIHITTHVTGVRDRRPTLGDW
jgi:hypothetical protein